MIYTTWEEFGIKLVKSTQNSKTKQKQNKTNKKNRQLLIPVKRELCRKGIIITVYEEIQQKCFLI